jgi:hypothetical protein
LDFYRRKRPPRLFFIVAANAPARNLPPFTRMVPRPTGRMPLKGNEIIFKKTFKKIWRKGDVCITFASAFEGDGDEAGKKSEKS